MIANIFLLFFTTLNLISFVAIFILLITNISYFIIPLMIHLITCIVIAMLFYRITNKYPLNDSSEYFVPKIIRCFSKDGNKMSICFRKSNGIWISDNPKQTIKLDLTGYLFQKSYIKSYVIRNLRYSIVSNKKPLTHLFKNKYFVGKGLNLTLILIDKEKVFNIKLVENGISSYGIIAKAITKTPFHHVNVLREAEKGTLKIAVGENDYVVSKKDLRRVLKEQKGELPNKRQDNEKIS